MNSAELITAFDLTDSDYYDPIPFDKSVGFSVKRKYSNDLIFQPLILEGASEPDEVCLIRIGFYSFKEGEIKIPLHIDVGIHSVSGKFIFFDDENVQERDTKYFPLSLDFSDEKYNFDLLSNKILDSKGQHIEGLELLNIIYEKHIRVSKDAVFAEKHSLKMAKVNKKNSQALEFSMLTKDWLEKRVQKFTGKDSRGDLVSDRDFEDFTKTELKKLYKFDEEKMQEIKKIVSWYIIPLIFILNCFGISIVPKGKEKFIKTNRSEKGLAGNEHIVISTALSREELEIFGYKATKNSLLSFCFFSIFIYIIFYYFVLDDYRACLNTNISCVNCCSFLVHRFFGLIDTFISNPFLTAAGTLLALNFWCHWLYRPFLFLISLYFKKLWKRFYQPLSVQV